jgi:hypothetical protein
MSRSLPFLILFKKVHSLFHVILAVSGVQQMFREFGIISVLPNVFTVFFVSYTRAVCKVRGLTYYFDSELFGGVVTVSFSKYFPWQAKHFIQRSTHFSKTCCRPLIISKFLASELPFHGWKSPEIAWDEIWPVWRMF